MSDIIFENSAYSIGFAERRDIGSEWNDVKWNKNHHQIGYHRLYYLTEGEAKMRLYGEELHLVPRMIYLIPAYSVLESNIEGKMNKYYIHFQTESTFFSLYRYLSSRYSVPANEMTEQLFLAVIDNYTDSSLSSRLKVQGAMNLLLSSFLEGEKTSAPDLAKFGAVLKYIDQNYKRSIRLDELSGLMNISTMYFSNYFKKVFRVSPKQYILHKRLIESQKLLLESNMSIKEIAYSVGFENENYFSEFFKAKTGISALKFRNCRLPKTRDSIL